MARVQLKQPEELSEESKKAYEELNSKGKITNMKLAMLQDYGTYKAFMGWYDSWASLVRRTESRDNLRALRFHNQRMPLVLAVLHQRPERART